MCDDMRSISWTCGCYLLWASGFVDLYNMYVLMILCSIDKDSSISHTLKSAIHVIVARDLHEITPNMSTTRNTNLLLKCVLSALLLPLLVGDLVLRADSTPIHLSSPVHASQTRPRKDSLLPTSQPASAPPHVPGSPRPGRLPLTPLHRSSPSS
jgi:hypothetical protein